jgi:hypothetical protein
MKSCCFPEIQPSPKGWTVIPEASLDSMGPLLCDRKVFQSSRCYCPRGCLRHPSRTHYFLATENPGPSRKRSNDAPSVSDGVTLHMPVLLVRPTAPNAPLTTQPLHTPCHAPCAGRRSCTTTLCINCKGSHYATDRLCPFYGACFKRRKQELLSNAAIA